VFATAVNTLVNGITLPGPRHTHPHPVPPPPPADRTITLTQIKDNVGAPASVGADTHTNLTISLERCTSPGQRRRRP